ncbi:mediator of RNA polymerase II transcription subunit 11 [Onychostruthus taczanowskii]|uniref:mediator of RNA polymerase II transcription subunit 11 n=1 Tax=Onychostruthus taczanowskii TaxID=356909 RepID=UPI001B809E62|nr:mediator of RNA polymerase II transcription subunit 11 [Onychostruthus taczanowskii]
MAGFGVANERLRALEELEREIGASLQSAGVLEPLRCVSPAQVGFGFVWTPPGVPEPLRCVSPAQVATGQPHEGSSYAARKSCQLALNRLDYARRRLAELARACELMLEQ